MRGTVTAVAIGEADRTADLTITIVTDTNVPYATRTILVDLDQFSIGLVNDRMKDLLEQEILNNSPLPLTKEQVEAQVLGLQAVVIG